MATISRAHSTGSVATTRRPVGAGGVIPALLAGLVACVLIAVHLIVRHRGIHHASALAIGDWLFTLAFALTILAYAVALGRKVARPLLDLDHNPLGEWLAALGLGYGVLSLGILCAGFLRLYYAPVFLAGAIALTFWMRDELRTVAQQVRTALVRGVAQGLTAVPTIGQRLIVVTLLLALVPIALRDMIPVTGDVPDWDGVAYHLSAPRIYLQAHRIVPVPDISLANAPSAFDIFNVLGLAAGTDTLEKVLNMLLGLGLAAATYAFGRRHFGQGAALFGVVLLFNLFWVIELLPATVPDVATAFFLVLGVSDAITWLALQPAARASLTPQPATTNPARWWAKLAVTRTDRLLLRAGLLLGFSVSCKLTSVPAIPAICLTLGLICLCRPGLAILSRIVLAVRSGVLPGAAAVIPLAPWLLKSKYFFGNPLYPQAVAATTEDCSKVLNCASTPATHTGHLWWIASTFADTFVHYVSPLSAVLLLAPFILRRAPQRAALLFVLIGGVLWLTFVPLFSPPRYWLGMIAISEVLIAATICEALQRVPVRLALAELPLVAYLFIQSILALSIAAGLAQRAGAVDIVSGKVSTYDYLAARVRPYRAFAYANEHLPANAAVATVNTTLGYYLDRRYLNDWYGARFHTLESGPGPRLAELATWCRAGVGYAVFNRGKNEYNIDTLAGIRPLTSFAWVRTPGLRPRVLFSARGVDVLALNPCAAAGPALR